jgi:hypothetical protein
MVFAARLNVSWRFDFVRSIQVFNANIAFVTSLLSRYRSHKYSPGANVRGRLVIAVQCSRSNAGYSSLVVLLWTQSDTCRAQRV